MHKLSIRQSALLGVAGNAPAYGVGIATATIAAISAEAASVAVLICGFAMVGILIAYQKLNESDPNCGAAYHWVGRIIHPFAGFLAGWSLLVALEFFMVSAMLAAGQSVVDLLGLDQVAGKYLIYFLAVAILLMVTIPSLLGASVFGRFQSLLTIIELAIVAFIAVSALYQSGSSVISYVPRLLSIDSIQNAHALTKGIVVAVFFFWGWDVIFNLSEETLETRTNSAIAALYTLLILIAIYSVFTLLTVSLLSDVELAGSGQNALIAIANKAFPAPYGNIALVAFLISVIGSLDASIIQFSRTLLSKSRDGIFSRNFQSISPQFGVPTFGILFTVVLATILTTVSFFSGTVGEIISAGVAGSAVFVACYYGLAGLACSVFFARQRNESGIRYATYVLWPAIASTLLIVCAITSAMDFGMVTTVTVFAAIALGIVFAIIHYKTLAYGKEL